MDQIIELLATGEEVLDVEEGKPMQPSPKQAKVKHTTESFLLFAQDIPTNNLGMIDSRAQSVEVSIHGNEYTIHQSPALLSGHRAGGTTGAGESSTRTCAHSCIAVRMICTDSFPRSPIPARTPVTLPRTLCFLLCFLLNVLPRPAHGHGASNRLSLLSRGPVSSI